MSVVGRDRLPTLSDQPHLSYTCAVILETHRLASVMPLLYPHLTTDNVQFMGKIVLITTGTRSSKSNK